MKTRISNNFSLKAAVLLLFAFTNFAVIKAQKFPLRSKYPNIKTISTQDLEKELGKTLLLVDARNAVEYRAIHIKGALNNKIGNINFDKNLEKLTRGNKNAKVVFYCNGGYCQKSFKAATEAQKQGYKNVFSYDAGIFAWANTYPKQTYLMGKILNDKSKLISKAEFNAKVLDKKKFEKQSASKNAMLVDVRDPAQRKKTPPFKTRILKSSMDKFVKLLEQKYFKDKVGTKTLYIFDAVGKQVKWLQYYLNEFNYKNYYFLSGGVKGYFK